MATIKFAILQYLNGNVRIVLQRDETQILERLQKRVKENLGKDDKAVEQAIGDAFYGLIKEFKDETIRIV